MWASLVAQLVKNPPAMRETWLQSLGWDVSLEKGKANHSNILTWRIPWTIPWGRQELDMTERLSASLVTLNYSMCICLSVLLLTEECSPK